MTLIKTLFLHDISGRSYLLYREHVLRSSVTVTVLPPFFFVFCCCVCSFFLFYHIHVACRTPGTHKPLGFVVIPPVISRAVRSLKWHCLWNDWKYDYNSYLIVEHIPRHFMDCSLWKTDNSLKSVKTLFQFDGPFFVCLLLLYF